MSLTRDFLGDSFAEPTLDLDTPQGMRLFEAEFAPALARSRRGWRVQLLAAIAAVAAISLSLL